MARAMGLRLLLPLAAATELLLLSAVPLRRLLMMMGV
jgi:hypothetical protein